MYNFFQKFKRGIGTTNKSLFFFLKMRKLKEKKKRREKEREERGKKEAKKF